MAVFPPDLNREFRLAVFPARPQPRGPRGSVPRRTSNASSPSQWVLPDIASARSQWAVRDLNTQHAAAQHNHNTHTQKTEYTTNEAQPQYTSTNRRTTNSITNATTATITNTTTNTITSTQPQSQATNTITNTHSHNAQTQPTHNDNNIYV